MVIAQASKQKTAKGRAVKTTNIFDNLKSGTISDKQIEALYTNIEGGYFPLELEKNSYQNISVERIDWKLRPKRFVGKK